MQCLQRAKRIEQEPFNDQETLKQVIDRGVGVGNHISSLSLTICVYIFPPSVSIHLSWTYVTLKQWQRSSFKPLTSCLCLICPGPFIHSFPTYIPLENTRDGLAYITLKESWCVCILSILLAVIMTVYQPHNARCSPGAHPMRCRWQHIDWRKA